MRAETMSNNVIHTAGYGNRAPGEFVKLLLDAGISVAIDVRRTGSKGRLRAYDYGKGMRCTIKTAGMEYWNFSAKSLGNHYDSLPKYRDNIREHSEVIRGLSESIVITRSSPCFICAEKYAYVDDIVNCHRVYVAEAVKFKLEALTGEVWEVVHL